MSLLTCLGDDRSLYSSEKKRLSSQYVPTGMKCFSQSTQKTLFQWIQCDPIQTMILEVIGTLTVGRTGLEANMVYLSSGMVRTLHHNHSHLITSEH